MGVLSKISDKVLTIPERRRRDRTVHQLLDSHSERLLRIGSTYGGWTVPEPALTPGATAICVGAGEDISFDVELNRREMRVFTLDPTPRAAKHVRQVLEGSRKGEKVPINNSPHEHYDLSGFDPGRLTFLEVGLSNSNSVLRFWAPQDPTHVSHSAVNLQNTNDYFEAQCLRLADLCAANAIDEIAILKMDVEGAEYMVLKDIIQSEIRPRVVCVEFDEGPNLHDSDAMERIADVVQHLKQDGYRFLNADHWNFLFAL
jgi:FkbM family methyltransferase